mmetsp:Transcript_17221/g.43302  ORF Transcript_17221/g.43302 Transcript_17221/m.43302 type:complete len:218 (-) Transcript_17221:286-939(-)
MVKGVARRPRVKNNGARDLLHKHKARHATACSFGVQLGHGVGATCMRLSSLFCQGLPECHQSTDSAVACVALMLQLPVRILHLVMPLAEHADGREALDVVRPAEVHLLGAVHLGKADPAVRLVVPVVDHFGGGLPCRSQPLAPLAPRRVEVHHHYVILQHGVLERACGDGLGDVHVRQWFVIHWLVIHLRHHFVNHWRSRNLQVWIQRKFPHCLGEI